jgi:hypothetical protein
MEQGRVIFQELTMLAASGSGGNVPISDSCTAKKEQTFPVRGG